MRESIVLRLYYFKHMFFGKRQRIWTTLFAILGVIVFLIDKIFPGIKWLQLELRDWILIGLFIILCLIFEGTFRELKDSLFNNWIKENIVRYGEPPLVPQNMAELIVHYKPGMRVSKNLEVRRASMQMWNRMGPTQKKKLLQLVEYTGKDPGDYEHSLRHG